MLVGVWVRRRSQWLPFPFPPGNGKPWPKRGPERGCPERSQRQLDRVGNRVLSGYCRLQLPLGQGESGWVAGLAHGRGLPPFLVHPCPRGPCRIGSEHHALHCGPRCFARDVPRGGVPCALCTRRLLMVLIITITSHLSTASCTAPLHSTSCCIGPLHFIALSRAPTCRPFMSDPIPSSTSVTTSALLLVSSQWWPSAPRPFGLIQPPFPLLWTRVGGQLTASAGPETPVGSERLPIVTPATRSEYLWNRTVLAAASDDGHRPGASHPQHVGNSPIVPGHIWPTSTSAGSSGLAAWAASSLVPQGCADGLAHGWGLEAPRGRRVVTGLGVSLRAVQGLRGGAGRRGPKCYRAGEVLRKSTRGSYGKRVSRITQKTVHHALCFPR